MKCGLKITGLVLLLGGLTSLGGCVYPAYYQRSGVVYSDDAQYSRGNAAVDADDDAGYYYAAPGYGYYNGYYNPWWGYGPFIGLGFYGSYGGGHGYRGPWRGSYYHHGGSWGGHASTHGGSAHGAPSGHH
jgi:hypothetical protein